MTNNCIRKAAAESNVKLWEIADKLGFTDSTFSRKLRRELDSKEQEKILAIIAEIAREKEAADGVQ